MPKKQAKPGKKKPVVLMSSLGGVYFEDALKSMLSAPPPKNPLFSNHYRVKKTKQVGEWVSATNPHGIFELRLLDGMVLTFDRAEIEPITTKQFMAAQKKKSK